MKATSLEIIHKPQASGVPMFQTPLPIDSSAAEVQNDLRNMWTWRGGTYEGDALTGQHGFVWNAVTPAW